MPFAKNERHKSSRFHLSPNWIVLFGFLSVILVGTCLLMLPAARTASNEGHFADALFTATSSTCVTGLTVLDISTSYTRLGQIIILVLAQIGGLGIMLFGTLLMMFIGKQLSLNGESSMVAMYGLEGVHNVRSLAWRAGLMTLVLQCVGGGVLAWRYFVRGLDIPHALYYGGFHSVMAYCNAGLSLHSDSLISFRNDPIYGLSVAALIITGGIGFLVFRNLTSIRFWRKDLRIRGKLSLHTKMVLVTTAVLILAQLLCYLMWEWDHAFVGTSFLKKLYLAFFHATTSRTAGFNMVPMVDITPASNMLTIISMAIGASPGSMAGGMKGTTLFVVILTLLATLKGRTETEWRGRTIPSLIVRNAFIVFFLYLSMILTTFLVLLAIEPIAHQPNGIMKLLFETTSAFGTVGLSLNTTTQLSTVGRYIILVAMLIGRIGPLSVIMLLGRRTNYQHIRYPEEEVAVG